MRTILLALGAACVLLTVTNAAGAAPTGVDDAAQTNAELTGDGLPDRWQGRNHYLYDTESRPGPATTGSGAEQSSGCATVPVRLRRSDGSTAIRRIRRCD
jgi:hypothetical protein